MSNSTKTAPHLRHFPHKKERPQSFSAMISCVLKALPVTVLLGALFLLIATALLLSLQDPVHYRQIAGLGVLYLTAATGGAIATLFYGRRAPVLCGFFEGVCLLVMLAIPSLFTTSTISPTLALLLRLAVVPSAMLGALVCAGKRKTRQRRF